MEPDKTGKRIVSKYEYAKVQYRRVSGWFHTALGFGFAPYAVLFVLSRWKHRVLLHTLSWDNVFAGLVFLGMAAVAFYAGRFHWKHTCAIESVLPLTRANTADLPAQESLVRASEEPMQAQEAVLLRASTAGQERHEEQLLRLVGGQER